MTPLEVLAAHRWEGTAINENAVTGCCLCGWMGDDHPAHVLDALTKAGHAVVTLPEADEVVAETDDENGRSVWATPLASVIRFTDGEVMLADNRSVSETPEGLHALGVACLAAAAAETGGKA